jgi:hypothetical protein
MKWLSLGGSAVDKGAAYRELVARRKAYRQCAGLMSGQIALRIVFAIGATAYSKAVTVDVMYDYEN